MTSVASLQDIIDKMLPVLDPPPPPASVKRARRGNGKRRPDREGTTYIAAHLSDEVVRQLRILAAQKDKTMQELLNEAIKSLLLEDE